MDPESAPANSIKARSLAVPRTTGYKAQAGVECTQLFRLFKTHQAWTALLLAAPMVREDRSSG
jgi:hypothetical protein